ncbi:hypothetical protein POM88_000229 [Heracleum sosnowskyi]|uniref:Uncharacterized protein n=1 Tax=Heracleum sosnowskyi TaxID=360622 RepID=A0AAD8N8I3_9APIA|nr:hypothetical protein POM88_000229 [Heracleum sosnowskyi]
MRSTSALYPSYPYHQNQSSGEMPNPGFGDEHYEQFNSQLYSILNSSYSTSGSYPLHQNQNHDYGVYPSSMTNNEPFSYPGFACHSLQEAMTYPVLQPAATQAQEQQVPVKKNTEEEVLVVKLEPPKTPNSRPRLIWTPELHAHFIHAVMQLGGLFSIQYNTHSHAPQVTEGEASSSSMPNFESNIENNGRLLGSYETPNCQQTLEIAPGDDLADYFNFEYFDFYCS